jgi:hypothetical protein
MILSTRSLLSSTVRRSSRWTTRHREAPVTIWSRGLLCVLSSDRPTVLEVVNGLGQHPRYLTSREARRLHSSGRGATSRHCR